MRTWGGMSDEEKGALLLAHHRGEVIEFVGGTVKEWKRIDPPWWNWHYYRVKKHPVVEVKNIWMRSVSGLAIPDILCECTYTDGKPTKIHWEAE